MNLDYKYIRIDNKVTIFINIFLFFKYFLFYKKIGIVHSKGHNIA